GPNRGELCSQRLDLGVEGVALLLALELLLTLLSEPGLQLLELGTGYDLTRTGRTRDALVLPPRTFPRRVRRVGPNEPPADVVELLHALEPVQLSEGSTAVRRVVANAQDDARLLEDLLGYQVLEAGLVEEGAEV